MEYPHFFNDHLEHISGYFRYIRYIAPSLYKLYIKKKTHSEPDVGNPFLLWEAMMDAHNDIALMGLICILPRFFLHPVYALVPDPSWSFMDAI